jgi:glycosyltransferase involved in cell wall biosynthesis
MKISYAIPVCNEHEELMRLLSILITNKRDEDEIVVQCDQGNTTPEVYQVLDQFYGKVNVIEFPLKGNFATFKNNLKQHCIGDWIFQIDADEYVTIEFLQNLHLILQDNPTTEVFLLPRINTVEGLTQEHINKWRWNVNEKGWVNFPDLQPRILQNASKINWGNKVHEVLMGHKTWATLPLEDDYCLYHPKHIERQERQNNLYELL